MTSDPIYSVKREDTLHVTGETVLTTEDLASRRRFLLARLAIERARLLEQLLGLDEEALTEAPAVGDWTVKDVLTHVAAWDRWQHQAMRALVEGEAPDLSAGEDYHAANDAFVALWDDRFLAEVLAELQSAREDWVVWMASLPEDEFFQRRSYGGEDWSFYGHQTQVMWQHDAEHAEEIAIWSVVGEWKGTTGPKSVLVAALDAARQELLACAALVPVAERDSRPVCGAWTLKDVLGHIADWEQVGVEGLRDMAGGTAPQVELIDDIEAWNQIHAGARRDQLWEQVRGDLYAIRREFLEVLGGMSQTELASYRFPWGPEGTVHQWVTVFVGHDREHAKDLWPGAQEL